MAFPTIKKEDPYIHFARDEEGTIVQVLQKREHDVMPEIGENDCGLFGLTASTYFSLLPQYEKSLESAQVGSATQERNFLPFISWLHNRGKVVTFEAASEAEAVGINTVEDANQILQMWRSQ